jgi:GAF domain-containing protein
MLDTSQVALLHRMSGIVSSDMGLQEMLDELIRLVVEVTGCDACLVYLAEPSAGEVVLRASQLPHAGEIGQVRLKLGEGITGWVAEHQSMVALGSLASSDERFKRFPTLIEDTFEAFLSAPLVSGGEVIGVINVHHREPHAHAPEEVALFAFLGEQMGGAISRARLAEHNERLQEQLETRKLLERAKGILQRTYSLTEEEAYRRLRNESRRSRRPMRDLSEAIILADGLGRTVEAEPSAK